MRDAGVAPTAGRPDARAAGGRIGELFEEHGKMVYGLCRLLLRDPVEAEDAAQQTFLSAHRGLLAGQQPRDPAAWLAAIARNDCRARIRARMSEPLALVEDDGAPSTDLEELASRRAEIKALCQSLAALPPQQRDAIVLREFYGLSYEEAATALGVSVAALESLIFRGRKRLQDHIRPARIAQGAIAVPVSLHESLASALPGFAPSTASAGAGIGTAVAKVVSAPVAAKLAVATVAVTVGAGTVGVGSTDRRAAARDERATAPIAALASGIVTPSLGDERNSLLRSAPSADDARPKPPSRDPDDNDKRATSPVGDPGEDEVDDDFDDADADERDDEDTETDDDGDDDRDGDRDNDGDRERDEDGRRSDRSERDEPDDD